MLYVIMFSYLRLEINSVASLHVLDSQKPIRAYVYCYVLSCRLKINFLILSYIRVAIKSCNMNHIIAFIWNNLGKFEPQQQYRLGTFKDQEKAQSEKDSHSKNRGGKKPN